MLSVGWMTITFAPRESASSSCASCLALSLSAESVNGARPSAVALSSKYFLSFW